MKLFNNFFTWSSEYSKLASSAVSCMELLFAVFFTAVLQFFKS